MNLTNEWIPIQDLAEIEQLKGLGFDKTVIISLGKAGYINTRWDTKMGCWTSTYQEIRKALYLRNQAIKLNLLDQGEIDSWFPG